MGGGLVGDDGEGALPVYATCEEVWENEMNAWSLWQQVILLFVRACEQERNENGGGVSRMTEMAKGKDVSSCGWQMTL